MWLVCVILAWVPYDTIQYTNTNRVFVGPSVVLIGNASAFSFYLSHNRLMHYDRNIVSSTLSKNGVTLAWMYNSTSVNSVHVADLIDSAIVFRTTVAMTEEPVAVALDQTGTYMATSSALGTIVVSEWNTTWHNLSVFYPPPDTSLHGLHLAVVSVNGVVHIVTSFYSTTTTVVIYNTTSLNYTVLYTTPKSISLDATVDTTWVAAIGSYETTEGGVENAGRVVVRGAHEAIFYGTDACVSFGTSVSITSTRLAATCSGPLYATLVYAWDGTMYVPFQHVLGTAVATALSSNTLAVGTHDNVTLMVETTSHPTPAPTRPPTLTASTPGSRLDAVTFFVFTLACLLGISLFIVIFCHTFNSVKRNAHKHAAPKTFTRGQVENSPPHSPQHASRSVHPPHLRVHP